MTNFDDNASTRPSKSVAIMLDTTGLEIKIGKNKDGNPINLVAG
jgi:pyruvate kinase